MAVVVKKQEKVLFVAFHMLLNLGEDLQIERKMKNRSIIPQLMSMLDRNNPDLLFIVLNFLKKLSIFGDNKNEMKDRGIIEKMKRFIPCNNELLLQISLRLLFNLSFDAELRAHMNDCGRAPPVGADVQYPFPRYWNTSAAEQVGGSSSITSLIRVGGWAQEWVCA